jgi:glycerol-3-phosphate dehydrogenase
MEPIKSSWNHFVKKHDYPSLQQNITTEITIIGGEITGITAGKILAQAGLSSVVLESHTVGSGTTSHSPAFILYN